jgi:hypothetical protein
VSDIPCFPLFSRDLWGGRCTKFEENQTNLNRVILPAASSVSSGDLRTDVSLTSADVRSDVTTKVTMEEQKQNTSVQKHVTCVRGAEEHHSQPHWHPGQDSCGWLYRDSSSSNGDSQSYKVLCNLGREHIKTAGGVEHVKHTVSASSATTDTKEWGKKLLDSLAYGRERHETPFCNHPSPACLVWSEWALGGVTNKSSSLRVLPFWVWSFCLLCVCVLRSCVCVSGERETERKRKRESARERETAADFLHPCFVY